MLLPSDNLGTLFGNPNYVSREGHPKSDQENKN